MNTLKYGIFFTQTNELQGTISEIPNEVKDVGEAFDGFYKKYSPLEYGGANSCAAVVNAANTNVVSKFHTNDHQYTIVFVPSTFGDKYFSMYGKKLVPKTHGPDPKAPKINPADLFNL